MQQFLQPNTCVIEGNCYRYLEVNADDVCLYCQPNMSASEWTWHEGTFYCTLRIPLNPDGMQNVANKFCMLHMVFTNDIALH